MIHKLSARYAGALLEYAKEQGLEPIHRNARAVWAGKAKPIESLALFLEAVPYNDHTRVLQKFIALADEFLAVLQCEVVSAIALTAEQEANLEQRLVAHFHKNIRINNIVDPSILGGVVIIAGHVVIDDSIRRKLRDMKQQIYSEVFSA